MHAGSLAVICNHLFVPNHFTIAVGTCLLQYYYAPLVLKSQRGSTSDKPGWVKLEKYLMYFLLLS